MSGISSGAIRPWRTFWTLEDPGTNLLRAAQAVEASAIGLAVLLWAGLAAEVFGIHFRPTGPLPGFWILVVLVPLLETLLLQALPAILLRSRGRSRTFVVAAMMALFALAHVFLGGGVPDVLTGTILGWVFSCVYAVHMDRSHAAALGWTALAHGLHNAVVWVVLK